MEDGAIAAPWTEDALDCWCEIATCRRESMSAWHPSRIAEQLISRMWYQKGWDLG